MEIDKSDLALWTNGVHYCVAESAEEAERMQPTGLEVTGGEWRSFEPTDELQLTLHGTFGLRVTHKASYLVYLRGRGYLFTHDPNARRESVFPVTWDAPPPAKPDQLTWYAYGRGVFL